MAGKSDQSKKTASPAIPAARKSTARKAAPEKNKSLESWIWDAACSIRGAKDAPKYKDFILPLIFTKRLCDVFNDELLGMPKDLGDYVIVHELLHFSVPNHGKLRKSLMRAHLGEW
jgi:hypothetical protein